MSQPSVSRNNSPRKAANRKGRLPRLPERKARCSNMKARKWLRAIAFSFSYGKLPNQKQCHRTVPNLQQEVLPPAMNGQQPETTSSTFVTRSGTTVSILKSMYAAARPIGNSRSEEVWTLLHCTASTGNVGSMGVLSRERDSSTQHAKKLPIPSSLHQE